MRLIAIALCVSLLMSVLPAMAVDFQQSPVPDAVPTWTSSYIPETSYVAGFVQRPVAILVDPNSIGATVYISTGSWPQGVCMGEMQLFGDYGDGNGYVPISGNLKCLEKSPRITPHVVILGPPWTDVPRPNSVIVELRTIEDTHTMFYLTNRMPAQ